MVSKATLFSDIGINSVVWGCPVQVNFLGNIGTYRHGHEYGMGGAACNSLGDVDSPFGRWTCNEPLTGLRSGTYWSIDREDETAAVWFTQHVDMPLGRQLHRFCQRATAYDRV